MQSEQIRPLECRISEEVTVQKINESILIGGCITGNQQKVMVHQQAKLQIGIGKHRRDRSEEYKVEPELIHPL
jgi:hypothetical protein